MRADVIMARSGEPVFFDDPTKTKILMEDIIGNMIHMNRYNGGMEWNLLQHHVLCILLGWQYPCPPGLDRKDLIRSLAIHDVHEIYVGDMVNGLKRHCPEYVAIEHKWAQYVHESLGIRYPEKDSLLEHIVNIIDKFAVIPETWLLAPPIFEYIGRPISEQEIGIILTVYSNTVEENLAIWKDAIR